MIHPLLPFAVLYDAVTSIRNCLYDYGILESKMFDMPVISVGNLAVGGTGKTPHTEYIISLLQRHGYRVAVLSRGYRRKTRGFVLASPTSTSDEIGDEPLQMSRKYPELVVAVDEDRCDGIRRLKESEQTSDIDVVVLDDAFQHRRLRPGLSLLLTDSHRVYAYDYLLPAGRLRENRRGSKRADIVVVTKMSRSVTEDEAERYGKLLDIQPDQSIYFSRYRYGELHSEHMSRNMPLSELDKYNVLLVTGIAAPEPMEHELSQYTDVSVIRFADHHSFTKNDYLAISRAFDELPDDKPRILVTTEKDQTRLHLDGIVPNNAIYVLPVTVELMCDKQETFNQQILDYVRKNSRNSKISQGADDLQP